MLADLQEGKEQARLLQETRSDKVNNEIWEVAKRTCLHERAIILCGEHTHGESNLEFRAFHACLLHPDWQRSS